MLLLGKPSNEGTHQHPNCPDENDDREGTESRFVLPAPLLGIGVFHAGKVKEMSIVTYGPSELSGSHHFTSV
jgi:hypothetical protein